MGEKCGKKDREKEPDASRWGDEKTAGVDLEGG